MSESPLSKPEGDGWNAHRRQCIAECTLSQRGWDLRTYPLGAYIGSSFCAGRGSDAMPQGAVVSNPILEETAFGRPYLARNRCCQRYPECRGPECTKRRSCVEKPKSLNSKKQASTIQDLVAFECNLYLFLRCNGQDCRTRITKQQHERYKSRPKWKSKSCGPKH